MKCPKCGMQNGPSAEFCRRCSEPLPKRQQPAKAAQAQRANRLPPLAWIACWIVMIPVFVMIAYKAYFWFDVWRSSRPYENGTIAYAQIEEISMDYGKPGHAVTIFGSDGDIVHIDELNQSYVILGGLVRIEVEDAYWFDRDPEEISQAQIELTPTLYRDDGTVSALPIIQYTVDTPYTPVTLVSPAKTQETVYSSVYLLQMNVVPASTVLINGEDVSDLVDRDGVLEVNVNVYPQGDNLISLYASTPNHKDTRMDIVLHRPVMQVALELSANTEYTSTRSLLEINGTVEPGAEFVVDTPYEDGSLSVDPETGDFTFRAKFSTIGYNTVRFRAVKEGCEDSIISFQVYYLPSIAEYSRNAWIMDYSQLRLLYEQWSGRVFQCIGTVYDVFTEGDTQYVVMNVGNKEDVKLIVLENMSNTASFDTDVQYRAYADVSGDYYYEATDYPKLIARYMDVYVPK